MAGEDGFEPPLTELKSVVLPLDDSPIIWQPVSPTALETDPDPCIPQDLVLLDVVRHGPTAAVYISIQSLRPPQDGILVAFSKLLIVFGSSIHTLSAH